MISPDTNPLNREKVELGRQLFVDPRLASDGTVSCETCHLEHLGWADGRRFSFKVGGAINARHTPTLFNIGYEHAWYWDGRAPLLEDQIVATMKGQMATTPAKLDEVAHLPGIPRGHRPGVRAAGLGWGHPDGHRRLPAHAALG